MAFRFRATRPPLSSAAPACFPRALALLPLAASLAFGAGCPEDGPAPRPASLSIDIDDATLDVGATSPVAVTSRGADGTGNTDAVTVVITKGEDDDDLVGGIGAAADALSDAPLTLTPSADGKASFVVGCTGVGTLTLTFATDAVSADKVEEVKCSAPDFDLSLRVQTFGCDALQADGASSCSVIATVRDVSDGGNVAAADFPVTVQVDSVTGVVAPNAGLVNGDRDVLSLTDGGAGAEQLTTLRTGADGTVTFFIVSPVFGLEETINFTVNAGIESATASVKIDAFTDNSAIKLAADPASVSSGDTIELTVTGTDADGTPAAGKTATVTLPAGFTADGETGEIEVPLDAIGKGVVEVIVPTVDERETFIIDATFQSIPDVGERATTVVVTVDVAGAINVNFSLDDNTISSSDLDTATLTLSALQSGAPFNDVRATVSIAQNSGALIRIKEAAAGDTPVAAVGDTVTFASFEDGTATVEFVPEVDGRGIATIEILVESATGERLVDEKVTITVERDPQLATVRFVSSEPTDGRIGVKGSSRATSAVLTFELLDDNVEPVSGATVEFFVNASDPGVTVGEPVISGANGTVKTVLTAGRVAGPVTVTAQATFDGVTIESESAAIAIVAGKPNSAYTSLLCASSAQFAPFSTECTASLGDRFTNVSEDATNVQFRAEGGTITPVGAAAGGAAVATFNFTFPGPGSADVRNWSYSPLTTVNAATASRPEAAGCFDNSISTRCDLLDLCNSSDTRLKAFCPLPPNADGTGTCFAGFSALTLSTFDTQDEAPEDYELAFFRPDLLPTVDGVNVVAQVSGYQTEHRLCGMPLSCLQGRRAGVFFDGADDCPVNLGCLDFSGATECPQSGLLDILASVNGEEGFDDENGNGVPDNDEDFVDFPEPFLDKNSSCSYDDLNDNARLTAGQKIRFSDLYIESDADDGVFGFDIGGERVETNGEYDDNTEIFVKTTIVLLQGGRALQFGEFADNINDDECDQPGAAAPPPSDPADPLPPPNTSRVVETARGQFIRPECRPGVEVMEDGAIATFAVRWTDANGNCPSVNFAETPIASSTGPIELFDLTAPLSGEDCGVVTGDINAHNIERPWCEEFPVMGAPARPLTIRAKCDGDEGPTDAKVTLTLADATDSTTFVVRCPVCGDGVIEGDEECYGATLPANSPSGTTCDEECSIVPPAAPPAP